LKREISGLGIEIKGLGTEISSMVIEISSLRIEIKGVKDLVTEIADGLIIRTKSMKIRLEIEVSGTGVGIKRSPNGIQRMRIGRFHKMEMIVEGKYHLIISLLMMMYPRNQFPLKIQLGSPLKVQPGSPLKVQLGSPLKELLQFPPKELLWFPPRGLALSPRGLLNCCLERLRLLTLPECSV